MKSYLLVICTLFLSFISCAQQSNNDLYVSHWNLENLFHTTDDAHKNDEEFTPGDTKDWNEERLNKKMYNLSRVIRLMNDSNGPDLMGVCEVEHQFLLDTLISKYLSDKTYKTAYLESPDYRGIDNGIIYNSNKLKLLSLSGDTVNIGADLSTRLILGATFLYENTDTIYFFVNHWPSRRGGEEESEGKRIQAAKTLRNRVETLLKNNQNSKIIIVGDFNDEPTNVSITEYLKAQPFFCDSVNVEGYVEEKITDLFNLSYKSWSEGEGSYKYKDQWNMIDQIIISKNLLIGGNINYMCNTFEVFKPSIMVTRTGKFQGTPFPTYGGSRYLGGYSDHFPVAAKFNIIMADK